MMNISIRMRDLAPRRLVCLAEVMKRRYSDRKEIRVFVFSSLAGARGFTTPKPCEDSIGKCIDWSAQFRAVYYFNAGKREEYVVITPAGDRHPFETKIELPATSIPPCALEVAGRCLLAVDRLVYPTGMRKAKLSGSVTLEGVITSDGKVKHVRPAEGGSTAGDTQTVFVQEALRNLKTWYFEPAPRQDRLRITYDYRVDPSTPSRGTPTVQFDLPHRVEIRVRPFP
jgi:TonB family protein